MLNIEYVMNYMYGRYDDLKDLVDEGRIAGSCSKKIMHGHFSNGLRPSIALKKSSRNS